MSKVTAFPISASRGVSGARHRLCRSTMRRGGSGCCRRPLPVHPVRPHHRGGQFHCPGGQTSPTRSDSSPASSRSRVCRRVRARRSSSARQRRAFGDRREPFVHAADHESLDARSGAAASPAPPVIAADDGALGERTHLLRGREWQRFDQVSKRPCPADGTRAPPAPRRSAGPPRRLERDDREWRAGVAIHERDGFGVRLRARRSTERGRPHSPARRPRGRRRSCLSQRPLPRCSLSGSLF